MLKNKWVVITGFGNMEEADDMVLGMETDDCLKVAYLAYSGVKIIEMEKVGEFVESGSINYSKVTSEVSNFEVAFLIKSGDAEIAVTVDDCDYVTVVGGETSNVSTPEIISVDEYDFDSFDELDEDLLNFYGML